MGTPLAPSVSRARSAALAALCVLAVAGGPGAAPGAGAVAAKPAAHSPHGGVAGVWRMDGYGTVVVIEGRSLRTYDTSAVHCVPGGLKGRQRGGQGPGGRRTYAAADSGDVTVRAETRERARLRIADSAGHRTLHRVGELPEQCARKPERGPRAVFDVFWQTYAENYPFFAARGVDWRAVRERYRPRVDAHTTDDELFAVLREMIEPLHDAHTAIDGGEGRRYAGVRPGTSPPTKEDIARIDKATDEAVGTEQRRWAGGALSFAELPGEDEGRGPVGYLRVTRFQGFTEDGGYAADVAELDRALDAVFTERRTRSLRGLVLDLRFNAGGADPLGLRLAQRLTDRPYPAYAKRARNDPEHPDRFTPEQPLHVTPHDGPVYTGPVAVLTGPLTVSAGETFTQALLGRDPAPARIGGNTQGAFSDTLDRSLPNGWSFALPNEEFLTADGHTFDGTGIPPTHRTPVFTEEEFAAHRDSALRRARELLG
ncbi:S41 family peptidase [Streptomyces sp. NPDC054796]